MDPVCFEYGYQFFGYALTADGDGHRGRTGYCRRAQHAADGFPHRHRFMRRENGFTDGQYFFQGPEFQGRSGDRFIAALFCRFQRVFNAVIIFLLVIRCEHQHQIFRIAELRLHLIFFKQFAEFGAGQPERGGVYDKLQGFAVRERDIGPF